MATRILFGRHEEHEKQVLTIEGIERAVKRGQELRDRDYKLDAMVLSPLPRAVATAVYTTEGWGNADVPLYLEERFGDFKTDKRIDPEAFKRLKANAKEKFGDDSDSSMAKCLLEMPELHELMLMRAHEGADALQDIAQKFDGKTVLVTSHGVGRMEIVLNWLEGARNAPEVLNIANNLIPRGAIVELTFEGTELKLAYPLKDLGWGE